MLLTHSIGLCILIFFPRTVLNSGISSQTIFVNQFYLFQSVPLLFQHHYPPSQQDPADRCEVTLGFKAGEDSWWWLPGKPVGCMPVGLSDPCGWSHLQHRGSWGQWRQYLPTCHKCSGAGSVGRSLKCLLL